MCGPTLSQAQIVGQETQLSSAPWQENVGFAQIWFDDCCWLPPICFKMIACTNNKVTSLSVPLSGKWVIVCGIVEGIGIFVPRHCLHQNPTWSSDHRKRQIYSLRCGRIDNSAASFQYISDAKTCKRQGKRHGNYNDKRLIEIVGISGWQEFETILINTNYI